MPITKSAITKLRRDRRRQTINDRLRRAYKSAIKTAKKNPTPQNLSQAASRLDRAAKKHIIHQNKASRIKSRLAKPKAIS